MHACRALSHPPSVGYSQQCLLARGSVLKRATETLLDVQAGAEGAGRVQCTRDAAGIVLRLAIQRATETLLDVQAGAGRARQEMHSWDDVAAGW